MPAPGTVAGKPVNHQTIRRRIPVGAVLAALLVFFGCPTMFQAQSNADQAAAEAVVASMDAAWAKGDADALAAHFATDGGFTNVLGMVHFGREAFRNRHDAIFKSVFKGSTSKLTIAKLRCVRPDVAIAEFDAEICGFVTLPPGLQAGRDEVGRSKPLLVLVNDDGEWWITAYHNVGVAVLPPMS